jgi:hypothetical protein
MQSKIHDTDTYDENSSNYSVPSVWYQIVWQQIYQSLPDKANQRKEENTMSKR